MASFFDKRRYMPDVEAVMLTGCGSRKAVWYLMVGVFSVAYYLAYHGSVNLHDISHYMTAGVAMVRDHASLIYPYSSMNPEGGGTAYGYFQDNARILDVRKNYPSHLYSSLFGGFYLLTGSVRFYFAHIVSMLAIVGGNLVLCAVGMRFFQGPKLALFIACIALTPVVATVVYPSNDAIGYFFSALVLWACLFSRLAPLMIGVLIGVSAHFRSQLIFFAFAVPILLVYIEKRRSWLQVMVSVLAGCGMGYLLVTQLIRLWVGSAQLEGGGLDFYTKFFLASFYGPEDVGVIADRFVHNLADLVRPGFLYLLVFTGLAALAVDGGRLPRGLVFAAFIYVAVPLGVFSLDRTSYPHARYYAGAVPFLVLSWFLLVSAKWRWRPASGADAVALATTLVMVVTWVSIYGLPGRGLSPDVVRSRLGFLDFSGAAELMARNFSPDDVLVTNHALPSGLLDIRNFIPLPSFADFQAGDNREIDGLVFVYATDPANAFFRPADWMQDGELPAEINDRHGVRFKRVDVLKSRLLGASGAVLSEASFVVYRNADDKRIKLSDGAGRRIFRTGYPSELTRPRIKAPSFDDPREWSGALSRAGTGASAVLVGPGPENVNVLFQRFPVFSGESIVLSARASSGRDVPSSGRLQVNWLGDGDRFLGAAISVFRSDGVEQHFRRTLVVPPDAKWGVVYVTPHGRDDVLRFSRMEVLGVALDERRQ